MGDNITKKNIIDYFKANNKLLESTNINDTNLGEIINRIDEYLRNYTIKKKIVIHNIIFQILSKKNPISGNYKKIIFKIIDEMKEPNNIIQNSTIIYIIDTSYTFYNDDKKEIIDRIFNNFNDNESIKNYIKLYEISNKIVVSEKRHKAENRTKPKKGIIETIKEGARHLIPKTKGYLTALKNILRSLKPKNRRIASTIKKKILSVLGLRQSGNETENNSENPRKKIRKQNIPKTVFIPEGPNNISVITDSQFNNRSENESDNESENESENETGRNKGINPSIKTPGKNSANPFIRNNNKENITYHPFERTFNNYNLGNRKEIESTINPLIGNRKEIESINKISKETFMILNKIPKNQLSPEGLKILSLLKKNLE